MNSFLCFLQLFLFVIFNIVHPYVFAKNTELNIAIVTPRQSHDNGGPLLYGTQGLVSAIVAIETINNKSDGYFDDILPNTTLKFEYYDSLEDVKTVAELATIIKKEAFGGEGADVVLGAGTSACTMALHSIIKHFDLPQVSPGATSGFLSVLSDYPYFSRPIPTNELLSAAAVKYAKYEIGWERGVIISASDPYSLFAANSINAAATQNSFQISKWEIFQSNTNDMSIQLKNVVSVGARLFFFCGQPTDVEVFFRTLYNELLLRGDIMQGFAVIYSDLSNADFVNLKQKFLNEEHIYNTIVNGSFVLTTATRGDFLPTFQRMFNSKLNQSTSCFNIRMNESCQKCMDGFLDPRTNESLFHIQQSIELDKICGAPNANSELEYYTPFFFDSILMIAHAAHNMINQSVTTFSATEFMRVVTDPSFSFSGATGAVRLDSNGDRISDGISFDVWNLKVGSSVPDADIIRYKLGNMIMDSNSVDFKFCKPNVTKIIHGRSNLCHPTISFNTNDNQRPDPVHPTLTRVNLGLATSIYRTNPTFVEDASGLQRTLAILMAIDKVNDKDDPHSQRFFNATPTIKYEWKNTARSVTYAALAGSYFLGAAFENEGADGVIGALSSGPTMSLQDLLKHKQILQLSPSATSPTLSNTEKYPYYYRVVPSDLVLAKMLVTFIKDTNGWSEVGTISSNTAYSMAGLKEIQNSATTSGVKITINLMVNHLGANMFTDCVRGLESGTRVFIVFLHTADILILSKSMQAAALSLNIDISSICFIFGETALGLSTDDELPVILNGSFALKPENGQEIEFNKDVMNSIKNKIQTTVACQNATAGFTLCDCIKDKWKRIFLVDDDQDSSTSKVCLFPSVFNVNEYYTPFAYDSVLTIAHLYNNIISKGDVKVIENGLLEQYLSDSSFSFQGTTGTITFDAKGDRKVDNLEFTVFNLFAKQLDNSTKYLDNIAPYKRTGKLFGDGTFEYCNPESSINLLCFPKFIYGTANEVKPVSVVKSCIVNAQCGFNGICQSNGRCQCASASLGMNCQQEMNPAKILVRQNIDSSKRCLDTISLRKSEPDVNLTLRFGVHGVASQITTEIVKILFEEMLLIDVHVKSIENPVDLIYSIEDGHIDYSIVDLHLDSIPIHKRQKVTNLGNIGYYRRGGWYVNKASMRPGFALTSYASFAQDGIVDAMNNISSLNISIERCYDDFSCVSKTCQDVNLCNQSTGIFESPLCGQHGIKCATVYAGSIKLARNTIQKQILYFRLPLRVIWLGIENLKTFVAANIDSKMPFLFYWWEPNAFAATIRSKVHRIQFPEYDPKNFQNGGSDFPKSNFVKLSSKNVLHSAHNFMTDFQLTQKSVNALMGKYVANNQNVWQAACDFLKIGSNFQQMVKIMPKYNKNVRMGRNVRSASSMVISELFSIISLKYLNTGVEIIDSTNDLQSMELLKDDIVDLSSETFLIPDDTTLENDNVFDYFPSGYNSQLGIYLHIPDRIDISEHSVNHYLYSDVLKTFLPPLGTVNADVTACLLWWCNGGHYIPKQCQDADDSCGEILVVGGLDYLHHKWSILAEVIHNLELPMGITFVTKETLDSVIRGDRYLVAFLSCEMCELSRSYSRGLTRLALPSTVEASSCSYQESIPTTYSYDSKKLGSYNCDFPRKNSYIVARKSLRNQFPAISTLVDRIHLSKEDIEAILNFHENLSIGVEQWISLNNETWSKWMIGCTNVLGKYGIEGQCKQCVAGKVSPHMTNVCDQCPAGTYTSGENRQACFECPSKTFSASNGHGLDSCKCIEGLGNAQTGCTDCPMYVVCKEGNDFVPNGFWRFNKTSYVLYKCPHASVCLGVKVPSGYMDIPYEMENIDHNESCAKGHGGILCAQCIENYYLGVYGKCYECGSTNESLSSFVLMALFLGFGVFFLRKISVGPEPKLNEIQTQLNDFRGMKGFDHVCIYFSDANFENHYLRFIEHSCKHKNRDEANLRRLSSVNSIFGVDILETITEKNIRIPKNLPRKILVSNKKYSKINSCFTKKNGVHIVEDGKKEYSSFFKDNIKEVIAVPIKSDLDDVRGVFMVANTKSNSDLSLGGIDQLAEIEEFVKSHNEFWASQSEDLFAILTKILLSHLQIYAAMRYIVLPWSGSSSTVFKFTKEVSSMFITYTLSNKCVFKSLCGSTPWIYCKSMLILLSPFMIATASFVILFGYKWFYAMWMKTDTRQILSEVRAELLLLFVIVLYNTYTILAETVYSINTCRELAPRGFYLEFNFDIKCYTEDHVAWVIFLSVPAWIIHIIGIPAFITKILHVNRHNLGVFEIRRYIGGLYNGFRMKAYFWEVVIMLRKMLIIGALYLYHWLGAAAQIPVVLMVLFVFTAAELHYSPYAWSILRNAERASLAVQIMSIFFANLFQSKYFQSKERRWGIEGIVGTLNVGYGCCLILYMFYFRGHMHYLASKICNRKYAPHNKKPDKNTGIQLTVNPLRIDENGDIKRPAPTVRRLSVRRSSTLV